MSAKDAKRLLARELFVNGSLGLGGSARMAEIPLAEWMKWLAEQGIAVVEYEDDCDLEAKIATLEKARS